MKKYSPYEVGQIVHINFLDDPCGAKYQDTEGEIMYIDDIGQLHGTWGGLALIPGIDDFTVIGNRN